MDFNTLLTKLNERDQNINAEMWNSMSRVTDAILLQHRLYKSAKNSLDIQQQKIDILKKHQTAKDHAKEVETLTKRNVENRQKLNDLKDKRDKLLEENIQLTQDHSSMEAALNAKIHEKEQVETAVKSYKEKVQQEYNETSKIKRDLDSVIIAFNEKSTEENKLKKKLERADRKKIQFSNIPKKSEEEEKKERMPGRGIAAKSTERIPLPKQSDRKMSYGGPALRDFVRMDQSTKKFANHKEPVTQIAFAHTHHFLATGSEDKLVNIYNYNDYSLLSTITDSKNTIVSLKFSEDDKYLLAASYRGIVRFYDVNNDFKFYRDVDLREHLLDSNFLTSTKFATAPEDGTIKIFEIGNSIPLQTLKLPISANKIATNYGDSMIIAGCKDGHVRGVDTRSNNIAFDVAPHARINILDMQTDLRNQIYTVARDGKICTIDYKAKAVLNTFKYTWKYATDFIQFYVKSEDSVLIGCPKGYVHELNLEINKEINSFKAHDTLVKSISKKAGVLVTGDDKGLVKLWSR